MDENIEDAWYTVKNVSSSKVMVAANAKSRKGEDGSITEKRILEIKLELEC